ncbi:MAG: hypothetical protein HC819_03780 [Cyclobacteriaceae bacterium]|nr:hypothetical protein [Cyclobacteriaceae bacterium]
MILKETNYAIISINQEKSIGIIKWMGKCTSEKYREAFLFLLDNQKIYGLKRFLSDVRDQGIISPDDRKWFENVALPKSIELGLKAAAVIFIGNVFKKYYLNVIIQATNKFNLPVKLFIDQESAEDWLITRN